MSMTDDTMNRTRRRGSLGKGLGALLGEAAEDYAQLDQNTPARAPKGVRPEQLVPGPFQPRQHFDAEALADLTQSVKEKGVLQPIMVRRTPGNPEQYQIIAGERRWRAASAAGLKEVPVIIKDYTDGEALEVAIIENVQRQDLNVMEEARGYHRLQQEYRHTQEDIARLVGKSRSHVANTLRLLNLPAQVQNQLESGKLSAGHARAVLAAGGDPQVVDLIIKHEMSVREAEELALGVKQEKAALEQIGEALKKEPKIKLRDANLLALETELTHKLGLRVQLKGRGQSGALTIHYQNLDQFDDLVKKLCG